MSVLWDGTAVTVSCVSTESQAVLTSGDVMTTALFFRMETPPVSPAVVSGFRRTKQKNESLVNEKTPQV